VFKDLPIHIQDTSNGLNHNYHKYVIRFENKAMRDEIKVRLNATIHYDKPLSENSMYKDIEHRKDDCINCKRISETILSLPIHPYLTDEEVNKITNMVMITV
jgi:dTDP-4-amino-4,6-dideoxygalactose transaminase